MLQLEHTYLDTGINLAMWKLFSGINKKDDDDDCLFNTHVVGRKEISQLWVLVWGQQRLFPTRNFITRSARLHPVCIRLSWHWILILMEKDYVIFTGTEIDYPFWAGCKVARVSFCRCWQGVECSWESSTRIAKHEQHFWLELSFHFPFISVVWTCCLWGLASLSRGGGVDCAGMGFEKSAC